MKKIFTNTFLIVFLILITGKSISAQIIIGTVSNTVPNKDKIKKNSARGMNLIKINLKTRNAIFKDNSERVFSYKEVDDITKSISVSPMVGVVSFPFKFRLQGDKDIETSLSLSGVGGAKFNFNKNNVPTALCILVGLGPSSVPINKYNSTINDTTTLTQSAATFSLTAMFIWDKMQIAASLGMDKIMNNRELNWSYQSKPWLSFGIGFSIFNTKDEDVSE